MNTVSVRDLRNHGGEVLARVAKGESLTVTRDGDPVASIVPLPRQRLTAEQLRQRWRSLPVVDAVAFRLDVDEILDATL